MLLFFKYNLKYIYITHYQLIIFTYHLFLKDFFTYKPPIKETFTLYYFAINIFFNGNGAITFFMIKENVKHDSPYDGTKFFYFYYSI